MNSTLNIIEPTLRDHTGHCHGYIASLLSVKDMLEPSSYRIWIERGGKKLFPDHPIQPYFIYKLRKLQLYFLYRRLIKNNEILFVPTAGMLDLRLLSKLLTRYTNFQGSVHLHFHQFRLTEKKIRQLGHIARSHPQLHILAPTEPLAAPFIDAGFSSVSVVPCPVYMPALNQSHTQITATPTLLYTGAARTDKGFIEFVEYLEFALANDMNFPIHVQATPPHNKRYNSLIKPFISRLNTLRSPLLTISDQPLAQKEYVSLFSNAITMLLYSPDSYHNKFSGVMLESLLHGAPVITTEGTWFSQIIKNHQAGIVIADCQPTTIHQAVKQLGMEYARYQANALKAASVLHERHHPRHTLSAVLLPL